MKKSIILISVMLISLLSGCASGNSEATDSTTTTTPAQLAETPETTTPETTTAPVTTTKVTTTEDEYKHLKEKDLILDNEIEEELFWNDVDDYNSGFMIPMDRYCTDWELYETAEELIVKSVEFRSKLANGGDYGDNSDVVEYEGSTYDKVHPEELYDCESLEELYDYYLSIYSGEKSFDEFCELVSFRLKEIDGELYYNLDGTGGGSGLLWHYTKVFLYDKTETTVKVMIAVPNQWNSKEEENGDLYVAYGFASTSLELKDGDWRIHDSFFITY